VEVSLRRGACHSHQPVGETRPVAASIRTSAVCTHFRL
jgi:hypothetical protein